MFTKKYLQDRAILFLNLLVVLLTILNILNSVLRIDSSQALVSIRYQDTSQIGDYDFVKPIELYSFVASAVVFAVVAILLSTKLFNQKRYMSLLLLSLTIVLLFFNLIVSTAIFSI